MGIPLEKREYYISLLRNNVKITAEPNVFINTIHGVKGGEADHVIIVSDMSKRTFMEMQKDPESEHRVSYVALTRAKKRITIVMPNSRYAYTY
jgi:superfamily I DNA/RNA helicase